MRQDTQRSPLDCRSEDGITVGLIDSIITISRLAKRRLELLSKDDMKDHPEVLEALIDLASDADFKSVCVRALGFTYPKAYAAYQTDSLESLMKPTATKGTKFGNRKQEPQNANR